MARTTIKDNTSNSLFIDIDDFGNKPVASSPRSTAVGGSAFAVGTGTVAIGYSAYASDNSCIAIGQGAYAGDFLGIAIGGGAQCLADAGVALGEDASCNASGTFGVALGSNARSQANQAVAISGTNTNANTVQYLTQTIANSYGIEARIASGAPSENARDGSLYVNSATNELYVRIGGAWLKTAPLT